MIYKWISLVLFIIIIYLLRSYWLPVFKSVCLPNDVSDKVFSTKEITYDNSLNKALNWPESKRIMPFLGSIDYQISRKFYSEIGFKVEEGEKHCRISVNEHLSFWLQNYHNKQWLDNSMVFMDVPDLEHLKQTLKSLKIEDHYTNVKISETKNYEWGDEFFMHDPSGILWHFCEFKKANNRH